MENNEKNLEFFDFDEEFKLVSEETPAEEKPENIQEETETVPNETETELPAETEEDDNIFKINFELLKEKGIIKVGDDYAFEPSEEGLLKALEESKSILVEEALNERRASYNKQGLELLEYLEKGGQDIESFISLHTEPEFDKIEVTEEAEDLQEELVRIYLKSTTKYSDDKIEKRISELKLDNKLFDEAIEAKSELSSIQKERRESFLAETEKLNAAKIEEIKEATKMFSETIKGTSEINGIPFAPEDAVSLTEAVFKPIKDKDGNITTKFNQKLVDALNDPKKTAILAKILDKDFNFDFLVKATKTKATSDLQKRLDKAVKTRSGGAIIKDKSGFDWASVTIEKIK